MTMPVMGVYPVVVVTDGQPVSAQALAQAKVAENARDRAVIIEARALRAIVTPFNLARQNERER
jgi:hypothetical protein